MTMTRPATTATRPRKTTGAVRILLSTTPVKAPADADMDGVCDELEVVDARTTACNFDPAATEATTRAHTLNPTSTATAIA